MRKLALLSLLLTFAVTSEARQKLQGYVAASASVTVKLTGTSTNATIYSDSAGTSKSNPFTAAADGFYSFYVDNGSYDVVTTLNTWTDIRVSEVGVTSNVMGFGAKCDGSTDDRAAIQRAIDVAAPNKVLLPVGICRINDELLVKQHRVVIEGAGPNASMLLFQPTSNGKSAVRIDLDDATVIVQTRLRGFGIQTTDTTYLKIGINIVDGSDTTVEDIAIGTGGSWRGGTSVSPFTGTGSIGIKLQGRDFARFRNVISCGAIPLYIANNPNFASIDLDHSRFDGFYFIPNGDNPSVYVEDGANLTNVVFENGAWVAGGSGFYWPDTTSVSNSVHLIFRNIRTEQFVSSTCSTCSYMIYITKASPLRGLRIEDVIGGDYKGVYLRGVVGTVFDTFRYTGSSECLNSDSGFDWRNSQCQTYSTANLNSLVEVFAEGLADTHAPIPNFGRWDTTHVNHVGGMTRRFMGVYQLAQTGSLTNTSTAQIPSAGGSISHGRISIVFKGATKSGSFTVAIMPNGAAVESTTDATITGVGNLANKITVHVQAPWSIVIRNNLGETVTYSYAYFWN